MRAGMNAVALAAVVAMLAGCTPDEPSPRSNVTLVGINGQTPLWSDVLHHGEDEIAGTPDDWIPEDGVVVRFANSPLQDQLEITENGPFGLVTFSEYRISFMTQDGAEVPSVGGGLHATVATGDTLEIGVVAVPALLKMDSPLIELRGGSEILSTAHLEFWGVERTSGDEVYVDGNIVVNFGDFGDVTD